MSRFLVGLPGMPSFVIGADEVIRLGTLTPQAIQRFGEKLRHEFIGGATAEEINALAARLLAPPRDQKPAGPASTGPAVRSAVTELKTTLAPTTNLPKTAEQALSTELHHEERRVRSRR